MQGERSCGPGGRGFDPRPAQLERSFIGSAGEGIAGLAAAFRSEIRVPSWIGEVLWGEPEEGWLSVDRMFE